MLDINSWIFAEKCPAGTYKGPDDNDCVECGPNTVNSVEGLSTPSCLACFHGSEPNSDKTQCRKLSTDLDTGQLCETDTYTHLIFMTYKTATSTHRYTDWHSETHTHSPVTQKSTL